MSDQTIVLGDGETAVVGYGLLLLRDTVDTTLGHAYEGPFVACHIEGWRRSWSVSMPNAAFYYDEGGTRAYPERILYMSARPDPSTSMNCTVFVLDGDELAAMHGREWIYDPIAVNSDLRGVRVEGGDAVIYVGKPEHAVPSAESPRLVAVRGTFVRMLTDVLEALDPAERSDFERTTDPIPEHLLIDDTLDPTRPNPWEAAGYDFRPESGS